MQEREITIDNEGRVQVSVRGVKEDDYLVLTKNTRTQLAKSRSDLFYRNNRNSA